MFNPINNLPASPQGRRAPVYLTSVGGIVFYNPLAYRGIPVFVMLTGTGNTFKSMCKEPPGVHVINIQQGSGSNTITTWPSWWRWIGGTIISLSTTSGKIDTVTLVCDGLNTLASGATNA